MSVSISIDGVMATKDNYRLHQWYFSKNDTIAAQIVNKLTAIGTTIIRCGASPISCLATLVSYGVIRRQRVA